MQTTGARAVSGRSDQGLAAPPARRSAGYAVAALTLGTALLHGVLGWRQYHRFQLGSYDLVIFDQAMRGYAHLAAPVSALKGVHNGFGPHFSVLGDHFSPILALAAPLYWLWADPRMLLAASAVLFALAVPVVWVFTRRALGVRAAYLVAAGFGLGWPLQEATAVGFHEVAFAVPLMALMLERAQARRNRQAVLVALALLFVKEDMGLVVAAFGVLLFFRGCRWLGPAVAVGGLIATSYAINVLIPHFGGRAGYYWNYGQLGPDAPSALAHLLRHPFDTVALAVTPDTKWHLLAWLVLPLGLACLLSPIGLLAVPLLAERLLSSNPNVWGTNQHYNAFLAPILTLAAVDGVRRLARLLDRRWPQLGGSSWAVGWAVAVFAVAVGLTSVFPFKVLSNPDGWSWHDRDRAAAAAAAAVPAGAEVEADNYIGPHLTGRTRVLLLDRIPRGADWVVADGVHHSFPFLSVAEQRERIRRLREQGYRIVYQREGYVVLHQEQS